MSELHTWSAVAHGDGPLGVEVCVLDGMQQGRLRVLAQTLHVGQCVPVTKLQWTQHQQQHHIAGMIVASLTQCIAQTRSKKNGVWGLEPGLQQG